jgi:hypothetical protein
MAITIDGSSGITFPDSSVLASGNVGTSWQSVKTANFTAVAGEGYPINTTSGSVTVTMPSSPSAGDTVEFLDYAGTFGNNVLILTSSDNINSTSDDLLCPTSSARYLAVYIDSTIGWNVTNEGAKSVVYQVDFLSIGGGGSTYAQSTDYTGGGGGGAGGYITSWNNETSGDNSSAVDQIILQVGKLYTVTVGAGAVASTLATTGEDSGIKDGPTWLVQSYGGGNTRHFGNASTPGTNGGCGGGGSGWGEGNNYGAGGSGTVNQGGDGGTGAYTNGTTTAGGGGGGAGGNGTDASGTVAGNGGNGLASTITGSSVTRAGGGGGGTSNGTAGTGGTGGAGNGANNALGGAPTANTGSGAGGSGHRAGGVNGASGVVILRMPTAKYSGVTTGSPTVTTSGSDTILTFTGSGSYTA